MKSLQDFKNAFKVGDVWAAFHSKGFKDGRSTNAHKVKIVQTNSVAFETEKGTTSWLEFPKASELTFINNNDNKISVRIDFDGGYLVYTKITEDNA